MRLLSIIVAIALLGLTGCAKVAAVSGSTSADKPASGKGATLPGSDIKASGFLKDYTQLQPIPGRPYAWRYVKPGVNWKQYDKIFVAPMEVWVNPEADRLGIHPGFYTEIDQAFKQIVTQEFQSHGYQVVDKPGPGVLVFRSALTGVTPTHQGFEPSDVVPIKAVINAGRYAAGAEPYYIVLSAEIEVDDGATGERVYAAVGARRSFETTTKGSEITWSEVKDDFTWVAKQWRETLDRAKGVSG